MKTLYSLAIVLTGTALLSSGLWAQSLQTQSSVGVQPQVVTNSSPAPVVNSAPVTPAATQPSTTVTKSATTPGTVSNQKGTTGTASAFYVMAPYTSLPNNCSNPTAAAQALAQWTQDYNALLPLQKAEDKCYGPTKNEVVKGSVWDGTPPEAGGDVVSKAVTEAQYEADQDNAGKCYQKAISSLPKPGVTTKNLGADISAFDKACPMSRTDAGFLHSCKKMQYSPDYCMVNLQLIDAAKASSTDPCVQYQAIKTIPFNLIKGFYFACTRQQRGW